MKLIILPYISRAQNKIKKNNNDYLELSLEHHLEWLYVLPHHLDTKPDHH